MSDTILITGGLGYIGGRIAQSLSGLNKYFLVLGDQSQVLITPSWLKNGRIVFMDIMSQDDLYKVCRGVRYIIHLAALNEIDCTSDPEKAMMVNGLGTLKLLRAAENAEVERFIYFSTAHIYGSPLAGIITEKSLPHPVHPYAITHRVAEDFVVSFHDQKKLTGIVLRLSNSFGAPVDARVNRWTLVVNDLCRQAVTSRKLILKTSGMQKRDFIPLSDVCRAVLHFLDLRAEKCENGIFNVGGENPVRIVDLAGRIANRCKSILGFGPPIVCPENRDNDVSQDLDYRIDKLKATGFSLQGNFDEEIDATLRLCKQAFG